MAEPLQHLGAMTSPTIWYIHPYAGGPGVGRYNRPYELSRAWQGRGATPVVITPAFHHLMDSPGALRGACSIGDVPYEFLPTPAYQGNHIGRVLNMAAFATALPFHAGRLVRRYGRPSMIVASSPHPYAFLTSHRMARHFGARSIFEVRDLWPLSLTELAGVPSSHPLVRITGWLERYAYTHADAVVSLLPKSLPHMIDRGLDPARWHYIPNGVDTHAPRISNASNDIFNQIHHWRAEGKLVVVYAGALGTPNNVRSLIDSIALLRDHGDHRVAAIVVGRGELSAEIAETVAEKSLSDRIAIFDQIPKKAIPGLLDAAQVGYISLRPEPLFRFGVSPNKLFDYMLARLPILFAISAGNDPVAECRAGLSVSPDNIPAIANALATFAAMSETERAAMGSRGHDYVMKNHGYGELALRYLEILNISPGLVR